MAVCEYGGLTQVFNSRKTVPEDFMAVCEYGGLLDDDRLRVDQGLTLRTVRDRWIYLSDR